MQNLGMPPPLPFRSSHLIGTGERGRVAVLGIAAALVVDRGPPRRAVGEEALSDAEWGITCVPHAEPRRCVADVVRAELLTERGVANGGRLIVKIEGITDEQVQRHRVREHVGARVPLGSPGVNKGKIVPIFDIVDPGRQLRFIYQTYNVLGVWEWL